MPPRFLLDDCDWNASGTATDPQGRQQPFSGMARFRHDASGWINDSFACLSSDPSARSTNLYSIRPLAPGARSTTWTSVASFCGECRGVFVLLDDDTLLASGGSADGHVAWAEYIYRLPDGAWRARSASTRDGQLLVTVDCLLTPA
ncbi:MAG: hypothetical protein HY858_04985 [Candidatus Solibacter usitatus]|nr:hypothetical protein [Candidatus Solibacter usitatus]